MASSPFQPPNVASESGEYAKFFGWLNRLRKFCLTLVVRESSDIGVDYSSDGVRLRVKDKSGGTAKPVGVMVFRGEWTATPDEPYMKQHEVKVAGGISAGTYVSVADNNTAVPSSGAPNWVQTASGDALGFWI